MQQKIFVIGAAGAVGATVASGLVMQEAAREIVLIDIAEQMTEAHAADLTHASAYSRDVGVRVGSYSDINDGDLLIITCGAAGRPGITRLDLLQTNAAIIKDVIGKIKHQGKTVFILMVSNPVDVLTYLAWKESGLPKTHVFGTGTMLDSARLRITLARHFGVAPQFVHANVFGEHGDSSFAALGAANVGGVPLADFYGFKPEFTASIEQEVRDAAYKIVAAGTPSKYGIGQTVTELVRALQHDAKSMFSVCSVTQGEYRLDNVAIGLPHTVSSAGVQIVENYPLNAQESAKLTQSARIIQKAIASVQV